MGESFTIQISRNLVNRLAEDADQSKKKTKKPRPKLHREPQRSQAKAHQKQTTDGSGVPMGHAPAVFPFLPVLPPPASANPQLDAIRSVLKESEKIVEKLEKHEEEMLKQVTQRAKELHEKEFRLPLQKPMPCMAEKDACLACYKEHLKDPLKCADVVKSFQDCTRRARQQVKSAE